jgi:hypothetical protein
VEKIESKTPQTSRWFLVARGSALGVVLVATMVCLRQSGLLHGRLTLAVALLAVLAVPTSRQLSRRILLSVCLAFGWIPLLWWAPLPVGEIGRATLLLAALVGALGGWVAGGPWRSRLRRLVPRCAVVDAYPPVLVLCTGWVLYPWLKPKSGAESLSLLMDGWDHSAHFSTVHMIRETGVTVDMASPPASGGVWAFASYPQSFHAVTATVIELFAGPRVGDISAELSAFCQSIALVTMCLVGMLVAGVCALPVLRRRPMVALPLATFVASVLVLGPGANAIQEGFVNFNFACALVAAVVLLVVPLARVHSPLHLAAIGGAVVGIAHGWILLTVLAAPAALLVLFPMRRRRWASSRRTFVVSAAIAMAVLLCVAHAALLVLRVPVDDVLLRRGGIVPPDLGLTIASVLGCAALCVAAHSRRRGTSGHRFPGGVVRVGGLAGLPVVASSAALLLVAFQLSYGGRVTYYSLKYVTGVEVVVLIVTTVPLAYLITRWIPQPRTMRGGTSLVRFRRLFPSAMIVLALTFAATQVFGFAAPNLTAIGLPPTAPGALHRVWQNVRIADPPDATELVEVAPGLGRRFPGSPVFLFMLQPDRRIDPLSVAQWSFALTDTWSRDANALAVGIDLGDHDPAAVAASASRILTVCPNAYVAVDASQLAMIHSLLPAAISADRVVTWSPPGS